MTENDLEKLLETLTLEEKVGQLIQLSGDFFTDDTALAVGPQRKLGIDPAMVGLAGSVLNVVGAEKTHEIQASYLAKSRHKIPLLFMADIIYGCKTIFPIPLGFSSSWDPALVNQCYRMTAREARAMGVHVSFAPALDLARDARWGRCLESTGEDPWLQSQYARAVVTGLQESGDLAHEGIASCIKHFAGYGAVESGREYNTVNMGERHLREMYFPPFRAAVNAGCELVMPSFNVIDDVPSTANTWLLKDVLRDEWGFDGVIISDYAAIRELVTHGVASDDAGAAESALEAGVDIDMKTACYANNLCRLVRMGKVSEELVDRACLRVLRLKNKLGLFEDPYRDTSRDVESACCLTTENRALARRMAEESLVLLENKADILPLDKATLRNVALIGPYAENHDLLGLWAVHGDASDAPTLGTALREVLGDRMTCAQGCPILVDESGLGSFGHRSVSSEEKTKEELARLREEALDAARSADVVIVALGEHPLQSGEAGSKTDLRLPQIQRDLLHDVHALGKSVIVLVFSGRPPVLTDIREDCDALIEAWFPGTEGARAVSDVLFGRVNPSARITMSFPYATGQEPLYYNAFTTGRPQKTSTHTERFTSRYVDCPTDPLYPFGYGLSYHHCRYGELRLSTQKLSPEGELTASLSVRNTSSRAGDEVVQLYIRDVTGSVVRPMKELKGFRRIHLEPGEECLVTFTITERMLRFWRRDMSFGSEPGAFELMVGRNSSDVQVARFELLETR